MNDVYSDIPEVTDHVEIKKERKNECLKQVMINENKI